MTLEQSAAAVTFLVIAASLLSKVVDVNPDATVSTSDLVREALYWKDLATHEGNDAMNQFQHNIKASTLLQTARSGTSDVVLERLTGVDVARMARSLDNRIAKARQNAGALSADVPKT